MSVDGFAELTLEARSLERLKAFYTEGFGLPVLKRENDRVWLAAGRDARIGLWLPGEKEFGDEGRRHVHFAFSVSPGGLDELAGRLRAAGADIRGPEEHPGGGPVALRHRSRGQRRRGLGLLRARRRCARRHRGARQGARERVAAVTGLDVWRRPAAPPATILRDAT